MREFVSLDNRIIPAAETHISALSAAAFYGRGVFTTIAVYNAIPFQWEKHWQRIEANAAAINLDLSGLTEAKIKENLSEIIDRNRLTDGKARLTFFDNRLAGVWNYPAKTVVSVLITIAEFKRVPADLRLTLSSTPINSKGVLTGVKSCNYLENVLISEKVKKAGFDEAARINENGKIVSAVMGNIFWVEGGEIFTAPLETGALAGTTRSFLLENFPVSEKNIDVAEFKEADEFFLTSAGLGVARVGVFDERKLIEKSVFSEVSEYFIKAVS